MSSGSKLITLLSIIDKVCEVYQNEIEEKKQNEIREEMERKDNIRMIRNILELRNISQNIDNNKVIVSNIFGGESVMTNIVGQFLTNYMNNSSQLREKLKRCFFSELDEKTLNINDNCSICFETMKEKKVILTICNHVYHDRCLEEWIESNATCPLCRYDLKS
jgi:hypothetical protein